MPPRIVTGFVARNTSAQLAMMTTSATAVQFFDIIDRLILAPRAETLSDTVIMPIPIPIAAMPFKFSRIFVIAWAAIAIVPRVETVD